ncbi:MAG: transglycosylase SLT domain-containing protein [Leptolyngbya sp. SIO1E4]|nr:transglycosylase SLT domain-containing protein [Leptolyngbya sp. SIO1E4]
MGKRLKKWMPWIALSGVSALGLGVTLAFANTAGWLSGRSRATGTLANISQSAKHLADADSQVFALALQPPARRAEALNAIASQRKSSDQVRARYLLASDLIAQGQGGQALPLLETLPEDYPVLAVHTRIKQGEAQNVSGQPEAAQKTWKTVLQTDGDQPAAAEALFHLGQQQPEYWEQLIQEFPAHPRSVEIAYKKLVETPNHPSEKALLMVMARHGLYHPEVLTMVDRLVETYGAQLTPEDWQAVGFANWENQRYKAAGEAYSKAPATPQTRYRAARGLEIGAQRTAAIAGYRALNTQFPDAPETATGLLKLSYLVNEEAALGVLDQVIQRFPDHAGEALLEKAKLLDALNSPDTAAKAREILLTEYSASEAAATLRARYARNASTAGNWSGALKWADELLKENADADNAAEIGFWAGKWALRAGQTQDAAKRFEGVIREYPESYFAWRSAVYLGWEVGDFQTVRSLQPTVVLPTRRDPLPAGSDTLQELYLLGQDREAWAVWQVEFSDPQNPSLEEQFTDGVLRVGVGDNLDGMFMVSSLHWRDEPEAQTIYPTLRQHPAYGQTLYPFPFADAIAQWSAQRNLNPLLVTALIRQESRFEPQIRSVVGAAGLMQVMPETAAWIQTQTEIPTYDLDNPNDNIKLGTWYLDYTHQEYSNHSLYAVASYNAGPGNVADWIARQNYLDTDDFVDKIPFPETKDYVKSVFGGYWNYLRLYNPEIAQRLQKTRRNGSS